MGTEIQADVDARLEKVLQASHFCQLEKLPELLHRELIISPESWRMHALLYVGQVCFPEMPSCYF